MGGRVNDGAHQDAPDRGIVGHVAHFADPDTRHRELVQHAITAGFEHMVNRIVNVRAWVDE